MLSSRRNTPSPPLIASAAEEMFTVMLMQQKRYAEAYQLLLPYSTCSAYFNRALCLIYANNYQAALAQLEQAQALLPRINSSPTISDPLSRDPNYQQVVQQQYSELSHLNGVTQSYINTFTLQFKTALNRLKVACYYELALWPEVIRYGTPLNNYKEVAQLMRLAQQKMEL